MSITSPAVVILLITRSEKDITNNNHSNKGSTPHNAMNVGPCWYIPITIQQKSIVSMKIKISFFCKNIFVSVVSIF